MDSIKNIFQQIFQFCIDGDHAYFTHINQEWTNSWFDSFMPFITDIRRSGLWIALVVLFMIYKKKQKVIPIIIGCLISVALSDVIAARIIKPLVQRDRPEIAMKNVRLLVPSQKSYGFPSNHAANTFAVGFFLLATYPLVGLVGVALAMVVSYSRVYVGVHFPLDVIGGGFLGFLCAALVFKFYLVIHSLADPIKKAPAEPKSWQKRRV